jgi:RNase P/RNase MRP subunit POP5
MTASSPSTEDLRATIDRLEQRLGSCNSNQTNDLLGHYWALVAQFGIDIKDERDQLLSRRAALMLIDAADPGETDE